MTASWRARRALLERIADAVDEQKAEITPPMEITVSKLDLGETELKTLEQPAASPPAPEEGLVLREAATTIEILARALHDLARSRSQRLTEEIHDLSYEDCKHHHCEGARKMLAEIREAIG